MNPKAIPISTGTFEHYARLKDARWLLDLFVDWTTKDGLVLGGEPLRDEDTAGAFRGQCTARTTRRWRQRLVRFGYISQKRTPLGCVIRVLETAACKSDRPKMADHPERELPNRAITHGSELPKRAITEIQKSELPNVADLTARNARSELPDVADHSDAQVPDVPSEPSLAAKPLESRKYLFSAELPAIARRTLEYIGFACDPKSMTRGFVSVLDWLGKRAHLPLPGLLASRIIDRCLFQQRKRRAEKKNPALYFWPAGFQVHRDRLRKREKAAGRRQRARVAA